ncbi:MAG: Asp-tRNA(Asn)/Glu-tRNA(Gln) amidotransferase subunit GatC [Patescibacteria group bacterium]
MVSVEDVRKLAALARIEFTDAELEKFAEQFEGILAYVSQLEDLKVSAKGEVVSPVRNVFREDGEPREKGTYTKKIVEQFPKKEGNALKVPQIISYD